MRDWIERWYGDSKDLEISEISIPVPDYQTFNDEVGTVVNKEALKGKQTALHVHLKIVAWHWLNRGCTDTQCLSNKCISLLMMSLQSKLQ